MLELGSGGWSEEFVVEEVRWLHERLLPKPRALVQMRIRGVDLVIAFFCDLKYIRFYEHYSHRNDCLLKKLVSVNSSMCIVLAFPY